MPVLVEIKAVCSDPTHIRNLLEQQNARFAGLDHQVDTYFIVPRGRLKLREGNVENALIYYEREHIAGPKTSRVVLYPKPGNEIKPILTMALGVKVVVDKHREIFYIDNVKFHIDRVSGLGAFVEIEAIDRDENMEHARLMEQCSHYLSLFGIANEDLVTDSYSDLLLGSHA